MAVGIIYVGGQVGGRAGSTSTSSVNFALTGGIASVPAAGDLVIISMTVGSVGRTPACAVSGYTALGQLNANGTTNDTSQDVSYKFMSGTPDTSFTAPSTGNVADAQEWTVQVFRGVDATTPMDATPTSATGTGTGRPNPAAITPVTSLAWVVICGAGAAATGANYTGPANFTTNFLTGSQADTTDAMAGSGYWTGWASGSVDPAVYTGGTTNAADSWTAYTLALRPAADVTAPTLSAQTVGAISATGGTPAVTTNDSDGTAYMVVVADGNTPSVAQIKAGQQSSGAAAIAASNQAVSATGAQVFAAVTGLTSNTPYDVWFVHRDASGNDSSSVKADFSTALAFADTRQAIINGIDSAQAEATGFDALRSSIAVSAVVRTSNTVVTVTLPALATYNITANETVTATVPASALVGGASVVSTPTITIAATTTNVGAASGTSTVTAVGASLVLVVGNVPGTSTVTGVGRATTAAVGAVAGTGTAVAAGASDARSTGTIAGLAAAAAIAFAAVLAPGAASGSSTALAVGSSVVVAVGSASSVGTATATGAASMAATGAASGASTVSAVGAVSTAAVGAANGLSTVAGAGAGAAVAVGAATGTSTVTSNSLIGDSLGIAVGTSTTTAVGSSVAVSVGIATGVSSVTGIGQSLAGATGVAAGVSGVTAGAQFNATRIYFTSSGTPPLAALAYAASWNKTSQATRLLTSKLKQNTAFTTRTMLSTATNPEYHCSVQYQLPNLVAQTISGTLKGQIRANVNNASWNGNVAVTVRVFTSAGVLVGTPLAITSGDTTSVPPAINTTNQNRSFRDSAESTPLTLTPITCGLNDVLVIEIGARDATAGTGTSATFNIGDPIATGDLPEDETTTTQLDGWLEFSNGIALSTDIQNQGTGSAAGTCTVLGVGSAQSVSVGAASGTSTVAATGTAFFTSIGSAVGVSTINGIGAATVTGVGAAIGTSTTTATANTLVISVGSGVGTSTTTSIGAGTTTGIGASANTSTVIASGASLATLIGSAAGSSTVTAVGQSGAASVGSSVGTSTGIAFNASQNTGTAIGTSSAVATGSALFTAIGLGSGSSTATSASAATASAVGAASGVSAVTAIGRAATNATGTASGISTVTSAGQNTTLGIGIGVGTSTVTSSAQSTVVGVGVGSGTSTTVGTGRSVFLAVGQSDNTATVNGSGRLTATSVGLAIGSSAITAASLAQIRWAIIRGTGQFSTEIVAAGSQTAKIIDASGTNNQLIEGTGNSITIEPEV